MLDIQKQCIKAGIPQADAERITEVADLFDDDVLKRRSADMLIQAWHDQHRPRGGGERLSA